jgi:2-dehydropantoate 2-reductase
MKIAVIGIGGLGGYYGGLLARVGHEVAFLSRGAHLVALRERGLQVKSVHGDFQVKPVRATDRPGDIGPVELVLVCVKTPAVDAAAETALAMAGPETVVMGLQNGIDAAERIGTVVGMNRVLGAVTWIAANIEAPGVIRQISDFRRIVLGELDGSITPRVQRTVEALGRMGIAVEATGDIRRALWTKFVFIAGFSGVGALTRLEVGDYRTVPETRALMTSLMREVEALAHASGVELSADVVDQAVARIDGASPTMKPSMQRDVEAGRPSELDSMIGVIARKGRQLGVPTPTADMLYASLLPGELRARAGVS